MAYKPKSWREKMYNGKQPKVVITNKKLADVPENETMVIVTPIVVDEYINNIEPGKHTSLQQMRKDLAATYNAHFCCPITSGIFLRIVAEAAYEQYLNGKTINEITPFWRMIDRNSPCYKKLSFGTQFINEMHKKESL